MVWFDVAVNVSAAYLRDPFLESRLVRLGEGSYFLDDPWYGYGETGFYGVKSQAAGWRAALGPRQHVVRQWMPMWWRVQSCRLGGWGLENGPCVVMESSSAGEWSFGT